VKRLARGRLVLRAAAFALLLAAAVPAGASAQGVSLLSTGRSLTVPPGGTSHLTLSCPGGGVALSGAPTSGLARASIPGSSPRRWTFRFTSQSASARKPASAGVRCMRMLLPPGIRGVRLFAGTVRRPDLAVAAGATADAELLCRRRELATGWGLESDTPEALSIRAATPSRRGYAFKLENTTGADVTATLRVRCLGRVARATNGDTATFRTRIAWFRDTGAKRSVSHSCRRNEASLATGVSLTSGPLLARTYPAGARGGRWTFARALDSSSARTSLICLALGTSFD
jgi:hypothetical protein